MKAHVCTLFEGAYHYGVAALTNSLCAHGFRGVVWAGYRGTLPHWAASATLHEDFAEFAVTPECTIRFVPVETKRHLTNYKPEFMCHLWNERCTQASALFYFDPDITIRCRWSYFEEWAASGVALCEDINSPVPITHPLRAQWRRIYQRHGVKLRFAASQYVNGGFVGVANEHRAFLDDWCKAQEIMEVEIGGLHQTAADLGGRDHPFGKTDQDALNIAMGMSGTPYSIIGKEGMDLKPGGFTMAHTLGYPKGWDTGFAFLAMRGHPPSSSVKAYFDHVSHPIRVFSPYDALVRKTDLRLGALIGRFYRRN
jgi:hypothetical protein